MSHRFLVTGGAGFIGSHIAERLLNDGHFVRVLDDFSAGKESNLSFSKGLEKDRLEILRGSVAEKTVCDRACEGIDFVLHHAARISVSESLKDPERYNTVNINGTLSLLQASRNRNVKRFVFASSCAVYGDSKLLPQQEELLPQPLSPYALTKIAGEYACGLFSRLHGLETVCLRYFNVFGPRQAQDNEYSAVIPKFIHAMLRGRAPTIFGDGRQTRDFTYIDNVVDANVLAATAPGLKHEVLNVATGAEVTILGIVDLLNKILGKNIKPEFRPPRAGDIDRSFSDCSKIRQATGFHPTVGFEEGLKRTAAYFKACHP